MKPSRWARPDSLDWLDRHPFLLASLLLHVLMLALLWFIGPQPVGPEWVPPRSARDRARIEASLQTARQMHLERRVQALEAARRALAGSPAPDGAARSPLPQALMQRAHAAVVAIRQADQRRRAEELSRLLKLPLHQALRQVQAEEAATEVAKAGSREEQLSRMERQVQAALAGEAARRQRGVHGTPVQMLGALAPGGSGASGRHGGQSGLGGGKSGGPGYAFFEDRIYTERRPLHLPPPQRTGTGHRLGAGGQFADRIYLDRWYIAGPFEALGRASLATAYPPEWGVDLDAAYAGKGGRTLGWRYTGDQTYPVEAQPHAENSIYYAYAELRVDQAQEVWLDLGVDDEGKLWLNDMPIWTSDSGDKPWYRQPYYTLSTQLLNLGLVETSVRVRLRAGRNTLLLKHYNASGIKFFSVVLRPA